MSLARLVITAVVLEGRRPIDVASDYGVSKGWVSKLVARYHADGDTAFEPRSRRPHTSPLATPPAVVALIIATRHDLTGQGLDAGNATIAWHLRRHHQVTVSESTIHRYLVAAGLVTPEPRKKPRASYIRFQADLPNECWQADFTHYRLATGDDTEILTWLDDHSRYALCITAHARVTGPIVIDTFTHTTVEQGIPYHPHRQRHGVHHPTLRRRRPQRLREPPRPARCHPEQLTTQPPAAKSNVSSRP